MSTHTTPRSPLTAAQRNMNIGRVAEQAAEATLAHLAHVNNYGLSDAEFNALQFELREVIAQQLYVIEDAQHTS